MQRPQNLQHYLAQVASALSLQQGPLAASLLKLENLSPPLLAAVKADPNIDGKCAAKLEPPFDEIVAYHLKALPWLNAGNYGEAYQSYSALFFIFTELFKKAEGNWILPVLNVVIVNLRMIAKKADEALANQGQKIEKLEDAERLIKKCFPITMGDRSPLSQSKKWGALFIINNLFKTYFQLNNLRLCKNLIPYVKGAGFPDLSKFPIGQTVTYNYFVGRLSMFDGDYKSAQQELSFAFQKCRKSSTKNKRLILIYLLPCELLGGMLPTDLLLQKYNLPQFQGIVRAIRSGNLLDFNKSLAEHQEFFIQKGIYLVLEKLTYLTYRNLFKKVYLIRRKLLQNSKDSTKLAVSLFQKALAWMGVEKDEDEIECILANLINQKYIRGYISHKMKTLVVSDAAAFPSLKSITSSA